ncbi:hypothetical protein V6667_08150 [Neisseria leonii]|uniref:DNA ligase OB-like domain-containing protein n=1 Tax=Neisseria leonii TaxID=2995413 RepID=A0A9X4E1V5_9NEIS|nr:hypothetical protein [Neisseria sp. 51.81]MDD9328071.1 hypothetical protein [Neisseria sp. 51.81]
MKRFSDALVRNEEETLRYESEQLQHGFEGIMLRAPHGIYKYGRSTVREGLLLKLKRFSDAEAVCTGYEPLMRNGNEAETDELGYTKRSSRKEGLVETETLGCLIAETGDGVRFKIGTGFTAAHREQLWAERDKLAGRIIRYKFFNIGIKEAPRHPVWLGFRHTDDTDGD